MTATKQPTLPATDAPDAEWLAQVREDAGRWWSTGDGGDGAPLVLASDPWGGWYVRHLHSAAEEVGAWPTEHAAHLWLWLALRDVDWHLVADPDRLSPERQADIGALARRLRAALGLGRAEVLRTVAQRPTAKPARYDAVDALGGPIAHSDASLPGPANFTPSADGRVGRYNSERSA